MKRIISSLLIVTMVAASAPALADNTPAPDGTKPPATISPLNKSQPAPFTGVLLSPQAVAQVVAQKDAAAAAQDLAVKHQADLDAAQQKYAVDVLQTTCAADQKVAQAQIDDGKKQIDLLTKQLEKQSGGPSPGVWIGLGAVGGVVLSVAAVFAVSRATK